MTSPAELEGSHLAVGYVHVPPQDPTMLPFLVHANFGARIEGSFLPIVKGRVDQRLSTRPEELHSWLRAG